MFRRTTGTNKPGLYAYFENKDDLARQYLAARNEGILESIIEVGRDSKGVHDFFRRWMRMVKDHAADRAREYNGCAVANFALQTEQDDLAMQTFIQTTGRNWEARLIAFVRREIKAGRFPARPGAVAIARQMLVCNEGAITMWKLTGQLAYFDEGVRMFEAAVPSEA